MAQINSHNMESQNALENRTFNALRASNGGIFKLRISDRVYDYIVEEIYENRIQQGKKITESEIAKKLQISAAPVREAMIKLQQEGWIERNPNRGAKINTYSDPDYCRQLYSLRLSLEIGAFTHLSQCVTEDQLDTLECIAKELERGIESQQISPYRLADSKFHLTVATFAGGERLREFLRPVLMQIFVVVSSKEIIIPKDVEPTASHRELLKSLAAHNVNKTALLISEHIYSQAKAHNIEI